MPSGIISLREDGSFQWTIPNFREMWRKVLFYSPKFTYNGLEYVIGFKHSKTSRIYVSFFSTNLIAPNDISVTFQLRTDRNYESKLHVSTMNYKTSCLEVIINFEGLFSEILDLPFSNQLTILLWIRKVNGPLVTIQERRNHRKTNWDSYRRSLDHEIKALEGESEKPSVYTNKTLCEEKKSECESKGENVSENANKHLDEEKNSECDTFKKLQKDLEKLFLSKEDTDVTLEVQQEEFLAHRAILRARSPVFYAMFSHEMSETRSGRVTISDCDPKSFPDFLMYLYTGNTQHISEKNVCHLYTVSDKYEVEELKRKCSEFMKSHISVETFCDFISLALKHAEEELIRTSTDFFCRSAVEITKTVKWQKFLQENSTVGNELFQKALLKRNN